MIHPSRSSRVLLAAAVMALAGALVDVRATVLEAPRSNVGFRSAFFDALLVASQKEGRFVVQMGGESMLPFFGLGSLAVVQPLDPAQLRPGMIAVYRNRDGEFIAHRVIGHTDAGWQVRGLNNARADSEPVNGTNLQGVLYATFHTAGPAQGLAASLATLPLVLGAPAK